MRAVLRFTSVFDPRIVDDPGRARGLMVQRGALETIKRDERIPVVIDHDMNRVVGSVRAIYIAPDVTGRVVRDWYWASCDLEAPPGWLKVNGGVSWSHIALHKQDVNGTTRLLRGLIDEVSLLTPSTQPAEPLARVAWIESPAAVPSSDRAAVGEVIHDRPRLLVRPGIGQVLGVR